MKLRVREGKATHKIEVPNDVTYVQLKEAVGKFVGTDPSGMRLSLNKQVSLRAMQLGAARRREFPKLVQNRLARPGFSTGRAGRRRSG